MRGEGDTERRERRETAAKAFWGTPKECGGTVTGSGAMETPGAKMVDPHFPTVLKQPAGHWGRHWAEGLPAQWEREV